MAFPLPAVASSLWRNSGLSGSKLIRDGEAVAVRPDGRAIPRQLLINEPTVGEPEALRSTFDQSHHTHVGSADDLLIGLQLTHSGRFSRLNGKKRLEPRIAYHHSIPDAKHRINNSDVLLSDDVKHLIDDFTDACLMTQKAGFRWVDIRRCHGFPGHEFLSGFDRVGEFGGSFEIKRGSCAKLSPSFALKCLDLVSECG